MKRDLTPLTFQTSILCQRIGIAKDGFYSSMREGHKYDANDNQYLDTLGYDYGLSTLDSRADKDVDPNAPICNAFAGKQRLMPFFNRLNTAPTAPTLSIPSTSAAKNSRLEIAFVYHLAESNKLAISGLPCNLIILRISFIISGSCFSKPLGYNSLGVVIVPSFILG